MSTYTLHYFNGRGRAELTRLVFAAAGVAFNDNRISDWPATKGDAPLGQLPYLEFNGNKLPQSIAMARYVAKENNLAGKNNLEQAQADVIVDTIVDGLNAYMSKVFFVKDPKEKEEAQNKYNTEDLPKHVGNVEKLITLYGKNGFSVGDSLTWADLHIFSSYATYFTSIPTLASSYPHVKAVINSVESNPKVAAYLKQRPDTPF